jgi:hypothetical protein
MTKRSIALLGLTNIMYVAACESNRIVQPAQLEPRPAAVLTRMDVSPKLVLLPGLAATVTIRAYDQHDEQLPWTRDNVSYSSSDTTVVRVDAGVVSAIAVGSAEIKTTLTLNGVTLAGTTRVDVGRIPSPGTYLLTATILNPYSPWGEYTCCAITAAVMFELRNGVLTGTYSKFTVIHADGTTQDRGDGVVATADYHGTLMIHLMSPSLFWTGVITVNEPSRYAGDFTLGDETATGSFTLKPLGG